MRSLVRPLLSALFLTLAATGSAPAQDAGKTAPPKAAAPAKPGKAKVMPGSPMAQVKFGEPAYPLTDDGTYRDYMGRIVGEYGRRCVRQEQFGWELAKGDQERLDRIFQGTMTGFGQTGYLTGEIKPKAVTDPETIVFLADRAKHRLLMVWVPMETSVLLMMCDTDTATTPRKP
ncbi:hypothetical protein [Azospirillum doebereinerae]|uniref:Uncharacterized protein n=1 Tax=Azospirillum doebereinerae TaxID=92933 RepID=A0A3S0WN77_9PROT|nr:hypothetical protein [Azospirillum doebereinerae]MCG5242804.1 hypothetical protein [Azospirillum doebereinerae]RUQ73802.1 hypothetical protein EJ913_09110 [Azospirillum doebereinerae]